MQLVPELLLGAGEAAAPEIAEGFEMVDASTLPSSLDAVREGSAALDMGKNVLNLIGSSPFKGALSGAKEIASEVLGDVGADKVKSGEDFGKSLARATSHALESPEARRMRLGEELKAAALKRVADSRKNPLLSSAPKVVPKAKEVAATPQVMIIPGGSTGFGGGTISMPPFQIRQQARAAVAAPAKAHAPARGIVPGEVAAPRSRTIKKKHVKKKKKRKLVKKEHAVIKDKLDRDIDALTTKFASELV